MLKFASTLLAVLLSSSIYAGEPLVIFQASATDPPKQPQAFIGDDNVAHLTFGLGNEVYYTRMASDGVTTPKPAFTIPNMSLGMRRGPRIAATNGSIVITAVGGAKGKGADGDVLAYHSDDQGQSWSGPIRVNDVESSAREGLHAMTASSNGTLWCVWLDLRNSKTELYASSSADHGKSWSKNIHVYSAPTGSICQCCHPSIVAAGDSIHILFRNSIAGNRDMYVISSHDGGKTFGKATELGLDHWKLDACPMDGGMLAVRANGKLDTTWRREGTIYTTGQKSNAESSIGKGEQPWIANNALGSFLVWTTAREGNLMLLAPNSDIPTKLADRARDPIIIASHGTNPSVIAFWEQRISEDQTAIIAERIR